MGCVSSKGSGEQKAPEKKPVEKKPADKKPEAKDKKAKPVTKKEESSSSASSSESESSSDVSEPAPVKKTKATKPKAAAKEKKEERQKPTEEPKKKEKEAKPKETEAVPKDKPSEDRTVVKDEMKVGKAVESETADGKHQIVFDLANDDHKYVVGKGGENIKSIRTETGADVQLDPEKKKADKVVIIADTIDAARKAQKLVLEAVQKVKDQHNDTEAWYQEFQKKVDEHARKRQEYFDAAKKAHDDGDGKLAKELSDKGKKEGELMKQAQTEAARAVFKKRNADNGEDVIDLHGLQVEPAVEIVGEYLDKWTKKTGSYTIITGKGLHRDRKSVV